MLNTLCYVLADGQMGMYNTYRYYNITLTHKYLYIAIKIILLVRVNRYTRVTCILCNVYTIRETHNAIQDNIIRLSCFRLLLILL